MPFARARRSCFPCPFGRAPLRPAGGAREQAELAGCTGSTRLGSRGAMSWTPKQGRGAQGTGTASS
eukprot:15429636-Alexandrium_andersonii.AAC.1